MKYLVIECHPAYAVLMDEASRFVRAANLHYVVGQTVTDPVLMRTEHPHSAIRRSIIIKVTAAAACLLLLSAAGFRYYEQNYKTESVVVIASGLNIEMELNSRGKVISLNSDTENGQALLREYSGKNKTSVEAVNDLLKLQIDKGLISDGDTVHFYIASDNSDSYSAYKSALETEIPKMSLNVQVEEMTPTVTATSQHSAEPAQTAPVQPQHDAAPHENGTAPHAEDPRGVPAAPADPAHAVPDNPPHADPPTPPQPGQPADTPQPPEPPAAHAEPAEPPHPDEPAAPDTGVKPPHEADPAEPPAPIEHPDSGNTDNNIHADPPAAPPAAPPVADAEPPAAHADRAEHEGLAEPAGPAIRFAGEIQPAAQPVVY